MRSNIHFVRLGAALLVFACGASLTSAQTLSRKIDLGKDAPVALVSDSWGDSNVTPRGGAYLVDVHAALTLRNSAQKRIRGVTLAVYAQEVTPGGKGSVSVPSLDVAPGDTFSVRVDMPLLRPLGAAAGGPAVEVRLDGVLFDDLTFYGPDQLHSQRTMTLWEMEARRDRKYFKQVLETWFQSHPTYPGNDARITGRVNAKGSVYVRVSTSDRSAVGSGRLSRNVGWGAFRGQAPSGMCAGTWSAQRTGG